MLVLETYCASLQPSICKNSFNKNAIAKFIPVFKLLLNIVCGTERDLKDETWNTIRNQTNEQHKPKVQMQSMALKWHCSNYYSKLPQWPPKMRRFSFRLWKVVAWRIKPQGSLPRRGLNTSTFRNRIHGMQFLSNNVGSFMLSLKVHCILLVV